MVLVEADVLGVEGLLEEAGGGLGEGVGIVGGEEEALPVAGEELLDVGVSLEVIGEALGDMGTLVEEGDVGGREVLLDFGDEEGVVGAGEDDSVDEGVGGEEVVEVFLDEIVGAGGEVLVVFDEGHPHWAGFGGEVDVGAESLGFEVVGLGRDGAGGGEESHMIGAGEAGEGFDGRADDAEDASGGAEMRKVYLLKGAERFCGGRIAGEDNEGAVEAAKVSDGLSSEVVDDIEGAVAVGRAGVVAEIDVVVLRKVSGDLPKDGESSVAGVENADASRLNAQSPSLDLTRGVASMAVGAV